MYLWVLRLTRMAGPGLCMSGILSNKDSQAHVVFKSDSFDIVGRPISVRVM